MASRRRAAPGRRPTGAGARLKHAITACQVATPMSGFWISTPFSQEPRIVLVRWRAWEVQVPSYDAPTWHLVGYIEHEHCAKVSSAVAFVHIDTEEVTTKTGRTYALSGPSSIDADAAHLWDSWRKLHGAIVLREVTTDILDGRQPVAVNLIKQPG
ncbi:hypothetical protein J2X20_001934 [Pelomonas saccharophila]|uniref:Uncharacterized protein n=1 Tax=Roseateles saccharophilus TaxID=304 RepID=A0ABU1YKB6_ROSSA|nr:hypothetical protein [Roseateles saccharophilus]MDR7269305.1 hypothetical protein [Roseateles saccharophilus]